jgi:Tol biopolymer transport system component
VYIRDRLTDTTTLVSVSSAGVLGNGPSGLSDFTDDGRYVAFSSSASNLVAGDDNQAWDAFLHDRLTGRTELISGDPGGTEYIDGGEHPVVSADGRYVAFIRSRVDASASDVLRHDRRTGATVIVSVSTAGVLANHRSEQPAISSDGRGVAFTSMATNLVPRDDYVNQMVFLRHYLR